MNSKDANYDQFSTASFDHIISEYGFDPEIESPFLIEKNKSLNLNLETVSLNEISSSDLFDVTFVTDLKCPLEDFKPKDVKVPLTDYLVKDVKYPSTDYSSTTNKHVANEQKLSSLKKRKKHQIEDPFSDEEEEAKRQNAIKAYNNREKKKYEEGKLQVELTSVIKERDQLRLEKNFWEIEKKAWTEKAKQWASEKEENIKRVDTFLSIINNLSKKV